MDAKHAFNLSQRGGRAGQVGQVQLKKVREREGETVRERDGARGDGRRRGTGCQPVWIIMTCNLSAFVYIVVRLPPVCVCVCVSGCACVSVACACESLCV